MQKQLTDQEMLAIVQQVDRGAKLLPKETDFDDSYRFKLSNNQIIRIHIFTTDRKHIHDFVLKKTQKR